MKIRKRFIFLISCLLLFLLFATLYLPFPKNKLNPSPLLSFQITDRNNVLLREILSDEGGRCHWVKLEEVSPYLLKATLASEDRKFYLHPGINFISVVRAFFQNLKSGHVVSGASTITQQLIRNIYHSRRNFLSKIFEAWIAVRLEHTLSKNQILIQYLNRISYGNQASGIEAASRLYFNKPASQLSLAESAFLASLPRSPSTLNPYRHFSAVKTNQINILKNMESLGFIPKAEMERALAEPLSLRSEQEKFRAPHFCDYVLRQIPPAERRQLKTIQTTLDYALQEKVETLLKNHLNSLRKKGITNGAILIMDNATGEILSLVGSKDFFDDVHDGQVNGALSLRQPGSTLKPFTYALALEQKLTAATILEDSDTQFTTPGGSFRPQNYDLRYHGPIRMRTALACSYNIPAVSILQAIGPELLYQRLKALQFESLKKSPDFYGVGLTLGNGEVTLLELCRAYSALARGGLFLKEKSILKRLSNDSPLLSSQENPQPYRVFSPQVAFIITHILADKDARIPSFGYNSPLNLPFAAAAKTGTSKDFRDNWTVGYTPQYTVAIWVGNFDGEPMHNVSGITGCGPLFRDIMFFLAKGKDKIEFEEPPGLVRKTICALSGQLPKDSCPGKIEEIFIPGTEPQNFCTLDHKKDNSSVASIANLDRKIEKETIEITFPQDGDIFKMDPILHKEFQRIQFKAHINTQKSVQRVEWWVNSQKLNTSTYPYSLSWNLKPGLYIIKVQASLKDNKFESRPVKIIVLS
jgi:penicillin-binding protein 1C